jgi:large subunit ribosomal protein L7/L12
MANAKTVSVDDLLEQIKNLTLAQAAELVSKMEEELGVTAAAPVMMGAAPGAAPAAAEEVEEKTEFDVELKAIGENKINVIKAVRTVRSDLGLSDAKALVEGAPTKVAEALKKEDADALVKAIKDAGGDAAAV